MSEPGSFVRTMSEDGVTVIELNRPERLNAIDEPAVLDLAAALRAAGRDPGCRVVVLTGAGRSFCAGLDLKRGIGDPDAALADRYESLSHAFDVAVAIREIRQPVIAAVRGHAVGAGFAMAAACDLRFAAPDARFVAVFTSIGMTPGDLGLSWFLPRIIGPTAAADLFYTGGTLDAQEAMTLGLLNAVAEDPLTAALARARQIAAQSPLAIRYAKDLLNTSLGADGLRAQLDIELRSQMICSLSEEHAAARASFTDRHPDTDRSISTA